MLTLSPPNTINRCALLLSLLLAAGPTTAAASVLYRHFPPAAGAQQLLPDTAAVQSLAATRPNFQDVQENSVGVLFTTGDGWEVSHIWLPLGKKVYTRDAPHLPLHPHTARITTMIHSTPQKASPEVLDRVVCEIFPRHNRTQGDQGSLSVKITRSDDLVRLAEVGGKAWPASREVEAYECAVEEGV